MRVLIVEDDANKLEQIRLVVRDIVPDAEIAEARSYQSGLTNLIRSGADCVLLDMSMPTFDQSYTEGGGRSRHYAGWDVLKEIRRKHLKSKVIVVTQFESFGEGSDAMTLTQLDRKLKSEFRNYYVASVFYQPSSSEWRSRLQVLLQECARRVGE